MESQSKLSQSSEAASWIFWKQLPLLASIYANSDRVRSIKGGATVWTLFTAVRTFSSPLHSSHDEWGSEHFSPFLSYPKHRI